MVMTFPRLPTALAILLATTLGCHRSGPAPGQPAGPRVYKLVGVVRGIDPDARVVRIQHEEIPGLMPAMEMPFDVEDNDLLEELRPGDEVEGVLRITGGSTHLEDLTVTRPAIGPDSNESDADLEAGPKPLGPGQEAPDFTMTTQDGQTLKLSDLRGQVVVLTFIYTRCPLPDFCPLTDRKFSELAAEVSARSALAERVRLLSVSIDPENDTPEVLARHARLRGAQPPVWTFAVASYAELGRVAVPLGLSFAPLSGQVVHNRCVVVLDPQGRLVRRETGRDWLPIDVFNTIQSLLHRKHQ